MTGIFVRETVERALADRWLREVGNAVCFAREAAGLSYREVAERTGLTVAQVRTAERGTGAARLSTVARIVAACGFLLSDLSVRSIEPTLAALGMPSAGTSEPEPGR